MKKVISTKKIKFRKNINRINFPIFPDINGETELRLKEFLKRKDLPKFKVFGIERRINLDKKHGYDLTDIYIEK